MIAEANKSNYIPPAIICDLDGTLALKHKDRTWFDASTCDKDDINYPIQDIVKRMAATHLIIFCSGRENKYREPTLEFIKKCFPDFIEKHSFYLYMRETNDFRKDSIVKHEIYQLCIKGKYDIHFVLDDRQQVVDMWRNALGLTTLQVAEGKF